MTLLTELDKQIIEALVKDPLESNKSLAERLETSQANIARRISRLHDEGVLRVTVQEEFAAAGLHFMAHLDVYVAKGEVNSVASALCDLPEVTSCLLTPSSPEILCRIGTESQSRFAEFLNSKLSAIPGIERIETFTVLEMAKYNVWHARIVS